MCQIMENGHVRRDVEIRSLIYQFDDYFTFVDLKQKLEEKSIFFEQKFVSQIIDEMLKYNSLEKRGIYFKSIY